MSTAAITAAIDLALHLMLKASEVSRLVAAAQAEGRDLSAAELAEIRQAADDADARLAAEIARAEAEGR